MAANKTFWIDDLSLERGLDERRLIELCKKPEPNYIHKEEMENYIDFLRKHPNYLDTREGIEFFAAKFALNQDTPFGSLVESMIKLMHYLKGKSQFFNGAYEFWSINFFNEPEKVPNSWKSFLLSKSMKVSDDSIKELAFAIETSYSLFSKLIVSKAMDDLEFYRVLDEEAPIDLLLSSLKFHRGITTPIHYSIALLGLIDRMRDSYISSVFEMDIFDWWSDAFRNGSSSVETMPFDTIRHIDDNRLDLSNAIMHIIVQICMFNFSKLGEDLFGTLYQLYFDKETRKVLGEFYTPRSIVSSILDFTNYKDGDQTIINKRFIDPACGSGTFIIEALKRFLHVAENSGISSEDALDRICNRGLIVGLDIHPFAVQLAQLNFVLHILPHYKKALEENRNFLIRHIPIYRTDSLYDETKVTKRGRNRETTIDMDRMQTIECSVPMPIKDSSSKFVNLVLELPSGDSVRDQLDLITEEYFDLLHSFFLSIKNLLNSSLVQHEIDSKLSSSDFFVELLTKFGQVYSDSMNSKIKAAQNNAVQKAYRAVRSDLEKGGIEIKRILEKQLETIRALQDYDLNDVTRHTLINYLTDLPTPIQGAIKKELEANFNKIRPSITSAETSSSFFYRFAYKILLDARYLHYKFGDGRLIRSIEDRILSILLKHYFKYDVVVSNPPYVRIQRIAAFDPRLRKHYESVFATTDGNYDIYIPFIERGLSLLLPNGKLGFICPNRFTTVNYGESIRELISSRHALKIFIDFRDNQVFKDVLNYSAIIIIDSSEEREKNIIKCCRVHHKPSDIKDEEVMRIFSEALEQINSITDYYSFDFFDCFAYSQKGLTRKGWFLMPFEELRVFQHILELGKPLSDFSNPKKKEGALYEGLDTGAKDIYKLKFVANMGKIGLVRSFVDGKLYEIEYSLLRDYAENAGKWAPLPEDFVLLFPYENVQNDYKVISEEKMKKEFNGAWKYLNTYKSVLLERKGLSEHREWYAYSAPRSMDIYKKKKLLIQSLSKYASISLDEFGYTFGRDISGLILKKDISTAEILKILAILNSSVTNFYVRHVAVIHGDGYTKFEDRFVKELPIKLSSSNSSLCTMIADKVESIMELASRRFPDNYVQLVNAQKLGTTVGLVTIKFDKPEILVEINSDKKGLKVQNITYTLDNRIKVELTSNDSVSCISTIHWRYIELCLLTKCEKKGGSIRISVQAIRDIFIPKQEKSIKNALEVYDQDQITIQTIENKIDDDVAELYELGTFTVNNKSGKEILDNYLSKW